MSRDDILRHRITPCRGAFRIEAVSSDAGVELVATWPSEDQAVEELRLLQIAADRATTLLLAIEDGPKGPRGSLIPAPGFRPVRQPRRRGAGGRLA